MIVLGQELSCNQSSTTCPGDVVQCECQVSSAILEWLTRNLQSEDEVIATYTFLDLGRVLSSGPYSTVLCNVDESTSPATLTSKLTVTLTSTVDLMCRDDSGDDQNINIVRLTVAGKLSTKYSS